MVFDLDDRARRSLARRIPTVGGAPGAFVVVAATDVRPGLRRAVEQLATAANEGRRLRTESLIEALLPTIDVPAPAALEMARQQAVARLRVLRDFGACSGEDVAEMAGSEAANRSALASRWRKEGRVFAVPYRNRDWFLGFQFDPAGRPLPAVAPVLGALAGWQPWDVAMWFVTANASLERRRPADLLVDQPGRVARAAQIDAARNGAGNGDRDGGERVADASLTTPVDGPDGKAEPTGSAAPV